MNHLHLKKLYKIHHDFKTEIKNNDTLLICYCSRTCANEFTRTVNTNGAVFRALQLIAATFTCTLITFTKNKNKHTRKQNNVQNRYELSCWIIFLKLKNHFIATNAAVPRTELARKGKSCISYKFKKKLK